LFIFSIHYCLTLKCCAVAQLRLRQVVSACRRLYTLSLIFAAYGGDQRSAVGSRLRSTECDIFYLIWRPINQGESQKVYYPADLARDRPQFIHRYLTTPIIRSMYMAFSAVSPARKSGPVNLMETQNSKGRLSGKLDKCNFTHHDRDRKISAVRGKVKVPSLYQ
jgi:hypothetical protein